MIKVNIKKKKHKKNNRILNRYRDSICTPQDVKMTFDNIKEHKSKHNDVWLDEYNYLLLTIRRLKHRGCDVKKLEKLFSKYEQQVFESYIAERTPNNNETNI